MKVINDLLCDDNGKPVPFRQSPNHGGKIIPIYIIIHYTAAATAESAISWMASKESKVSAQLHEDRLGNFVQMTLLNDRAYHAGESQWDGIIGLNSHSIGIELQNLGNQEYTQIQLDNLLVACKALCLAYPIKDVLGHSDIAPKRKIDPGEQFPMQWLRESLFGKKGEIIKAVTASDLNLRSGAGTKFSKVSVLPKATSVNILVTDGDWSQVFVPGSKLTGWLNNKYLS